MQFAVFWNLLEKDTHLPLLFTLHSRLDLDGGVNLGISLWEGIIDQKCIMVMEDHLFVIFN